MVEFLVKHKLINTSQHGFLKARSCLTIDMNRTPVSKTRPLSSYQLTHDKVMQAWTSDIHAAAWQEPTGGPVFILYSTQSSSYIY